MKNKLKSASTPNKQEQEHLNINQRTPTFSKNNTTKSPLLKIPKESKVRSGFKYAPREHVGLDGVESSVRSSKVWKQVEEEWKQVEKQQGAFCKREWSYTEGKTLPWATERS